MSLKELLSKLIKKKEYTSYGEIVEVALEYGAKIGTAERRLRELMEKDEILSINGISKKGVKYIKGYSPNIKGSSPRHGVVEYTSKYTTPPTQGYGIVKFINRMDAMKPKEKKELPML